MRRAGRAAAPSRAPTACASRRGATLLAPRARRPRTPRTEGGAPQAHPPRLNAPPIPASTPTTASRPSSSSRTFTTCPRSAPVTPFESVSIRHTIIEHTRHEAQKIAPRCVCLCGHQLPPARHRPRLPATPRASARAPKRMGACPVRRPTRARPARRARPAGGRAPERARRGRGRGRGGPPP